MQYRRLGNSALLVSELSLGSWETFKEGAGISSAERAFELMSAAFAAGVTTFDNASVYGAGEAESIMGDAVRMGVERGTWVRQDLVLTTKLFWGDMAPRGRADYLAGRKPMNRLGLSRKSIVEGLRASLARMQLDHVDVVFAHRCEPMQMLNMEEVVRAFNHVIDRGMAFYWATSEWSAQQIEEARGVADRLGLVGPICDQPEYR